jgi:hypothetical protein
VRQSGATASGRAAGRRGRKTEEGRALEEGGKGKGGADVRGWPGRERNERRARGVAGLRELGLGGPCGERR